MRADGGVDASDRQCAVLALLQLAMSGRVVERVEHRLLCDTVSPAPCRAMPLGGLENRLVALSASSSGFDSGHDGPLNSIGMSLQALV